MRNCENELVYALSEFKTISREAAVSLLEKRNMTEADKIIESMIKRGGIYEKDGYLSLLPKMTVDTRMWTAFDVLLAFIPPVAPKEYYAANEPAHIVFIKEGKEYIIVSIFNGDENNISIMANTSAFNDNSTYIIAVNDAKIIDKLPVMESQTIFALVQNGEVDFYERNSIGNE